MNDNPVTYKVAVTSTSNKTIASMAMDTAYCALRIVGNSVNTLSVLTEVCSDRAYAYRERQALRNIIKHNELMDKLSKQAEQLKLVLE